VQHGSAAPNANTALLREARCKKAQAFNKSWYGPTSTACSAGAHGRHKKRRQRVSSAPIRARATGPSLVGAHSRAALSSHARLLTFVLLEWTDPR